VKRTFLFLFVLLFVSFGLSRGRVYGQEPLDGPNHQFKDELLDNLVGDWKLTRQIRGQTVQNEPSPPTRYGGRNRSFRE
jgi:hypothetical protein